MANRTYTDIEKAQALAAFAACGNNASKAAKATGIPRKTISQWAAGTVGVKSIANLPSLTADAKIELADKLDGIAHALADAMPSKIEKASLQQVAISMAVAIDKRALLRGQPTSITENRTERARFETAIGQLIAECKSRGFTIDKEEAVRLLEPHVGPEIKRYYPEASPVGEQPPAPQA